MMVTIPEAADVQRERLAYDIRSDALAQAILYRSTDDPAETLAVAAQFRDFLAGRLDFVPPATSPAVPAAETVEYSPAVIPAARDRRRAKRRPGPANMRPQ